jgi:hypothetical protein
MVDPPRHKHALIKDEYGEFFDPQRYLRQYYSLPQLAVDDAELFRNLGQWLRNTGRTYENVLDIGCGPTIHNSFAIALYANRIELADLLAANLAEVKKWLDGDTQAHDWDALMRGVLECQDEDPCRLAERQALFRSRVVALRTCDLRAKNPFGNTMRYDLVTSFFCPECITQTKSEWEVVMHRVLDLVEPGGAVFFAALRNCRQYAVLGRWFPTTPVDERDFLALLSSRGYDAMRAEATPAPDWRDDGFEHILLVSATHQLPK